MLLITLSSLDTFLSMAPWITHPPVFQKHSDHPLSVSGFWFYLASPLNSRVSQGSDLGLFSGYSHCLGLIIQCQWKSGFQYHLCAKDSRFISLALHFAPNSTHLSDSLVNNPIRMSNRYLTPNMLKTMLSMWKLFLPLSSQYQLMQLHPFNCKNKNTGVTLDISLFIILHLILQ